MSREAHAFATVLVLSWGLVHPGPRSRRELGRMLSAKLPPSATLRWIRTPAELAHRTQQNPPDLLVLHYHAKREPYAPEGFVNVLSSYLGNGGRILALHATTASFKQDDGYATLLGGRFAGHARVGPISISSRDSSNPKFMLVDELYAHEITDDVAVVASAASGEPVAWLRSVGSGRLAYASPGHRPQTFADAGYRRLMSAILSQLEADA